MATRNELVQINISLPMSHVSILPELMKVVSTASRSSYSWDSMKVSVGSDVPCDQGSRMIVNLGKRVNDESEIIQGMIHRCFESVCRHGDPSEALVGEVKMINHFQKTLKDHLKESAISDDEVIDGTGFLEKDLSNEMFFPSWYDNLRLKSAPQLGVELFQHEKQVSSTPSPVFIVNNVNVHHFYESENEMFLPKSSTKIFSKEPKQTSNETFRLKKICDRAKTNVQPTECEREISPQNVKLKIRELMKRIDPPEIYEDNFVYTKTEETDESREREITYGQYLSYDEELPPYHIRDKEDHSLHDHKLQKSFLRNISEENIHALPKPKIKRNGGLELVPIEINKRSLFHRWFSTNALPRIGLGNTFSKDRNQLKKKKKEKIRPKSGPAEGAELTRTFKNNFSIGDPPIISVHRSAHKRASSRQKLKKDEGDQDQQKEKRKKRKTHQREVTEDKEANDIHKELTSKDHEKKTKKGQKGDGIEGRKLIISYNPFAEETKLDINEMKTKNRHNDKEDGESKRHRKTKKLVDEKAEEHQVAVKYEEKPDGKKNRGENENKKSRKNKVEKNDQHKAKDHAILMPGDSSRNIIDHKAVEQTTGIFDTNTLWRRHFKKESLDPIINEETQPTTEEQVKIQLDDNTSKRALSFLEIISVIADEVKHLGRKKDRKKNKVS